MTSIDRSATKCIRLILWSPKLLAYWKKEQKYFRLTSKDSKKLNHARNGESRLNYLLDLKKEEALITCWFELGNVVVV